MVTAKEMLSADSPFNKLLEISSKMGTEIQRCLENHSALKDFFFENMQSAEMLGELIQDERTLKEATQVHQQLKKDFSLNHVPGDILARHLVHKQHPQIETQEKRFFEQFKKGTINLNQLKLLLEQAL